MKFAVIGTGVTIINLAVMALVSTVLSIDNGQLVAYVGALFAGCPLTTLTTQSLVIADLVRYARSSNPELSHV